MRLLIEIPDEMYKTIQDGTYCGSLYEELKNGIPQETVTEFADRCRECGARYGKTLKRYIEKDIEMLNEIIESGWLISDLEKCPAIDACEDAITALKQYPILDKVRAEIDAHREKLKIMADDDWYAGKIRGYDCAIEIIDKYRGNIDEN